MRDWNLSLLLIRIIETTTGDTWNDVRRELQRLHVNYFTGPADTYHQTTQTTPTQQRILTRLDLTAPPPDPATQHRLSLAAAAATGDHAVSPVWHAFPQVNAHILVGIYRYSRFT